MDNSLLNHMAAAHPYYFSAASFVAGIFVKHYLPKFETEGVDWLSAKALTLQKQALVKSGASPAEIKAFEAHEAAVLTRAAENFKKDSEDQKS